MNPSLPKVSCVCPTYNRISRNPAMLNEMLYWFLRQDYPGPLELVVLNDAKNQYLFTNLNVRRDIRIINESIRYPTLGDKFNALVELATGEIILPWEDDDISLPGRVSQAVAKLDGFDYWNPKGAFFQNGTDAKLALCSPHSVHHNASAYRKDMWRKLKYRTDRYGGFRQDMFMDQDIRQCRTSRVNDGYVKPEDMTYIYRWCASPGCRNLSGHPDPAVGWDAEPAPAPGMTAIEIKAEMSRDYEEEAKAYLSKLNPVAGA